MQDIYDYIIINNIFYLHLIFFEIIYLQLHSLNFLFFFLQKIFLLDIWEELGHLHVLSRKYLDKYIHFLMKVYIINNHYFHYLLNFPIFLLILHNLEMIYAFFLIHKIFLKQNI